MNVSQHGIQRSVFCLSLGVVCLKQVSNKQSSDLEVGGPERLIAVGNKSKGESRWLLRDLDIALAPRVKVVKRRDPCQKLREERERTSAPRFREGASLALASMIKRGKSKSRGEGSSANGHERAGSRFEPSYIRLHRTFFKAKASTLSS